MVGVSRNIECQKCFDFGLLVLGEGKPQNYMTMMCKRGRGMVKGLVDPKHPPKSAVGDISGNNYFFFRESPVNYKPYFFLKYKNASECIV